MFEEGAICPSVKLYAQGQLNDGLYDALLRWPVDGRHYSKWLGAFFKAQIPGIIINEDVTQVFRFLSRFTQSEPDESNYYATT